VRARGTNLPPGTPFETDAQGNPLNDPDVEAVPTPAFVACSDPACPAHMKTLPNGSKLSSYDVAAWSDLWFYANPIFIRVAGQSPLLVETNADKAKQIAASLGR
jgi:hypothetical protein